MDMRTYNDKFTSRWTRERDIGRIRLCVTRHINRQCLSLGVTFSWNSRPSVEVDFLLWRFDIEVLEPEKKL
jgi:hypothetical protein